jgi:sugar lactone lactonase YvrE
LTTTRSAAALTVSPARAVAGARVRIAAGHLPLPIEGLPHVLIGGADARVVAASSSGVTCVVPPDAPGGEQPVTIDELPGAGGRMWVGGLVAADVHQVDSPVFDAAGNLYATHSGTRDAKPTVPLFRIGTDGTKTPIVAEIGNPTSMAFAPDGALFVSSRFDGTIYRLAFDGPDDTAPDITRFATDLGVATGLAFSPDGDLYVGDRLGSIFRVRPDKQVDTFATLPASVAAFHLAFGPDGCLYVTAPTLSTHDALYRISPERLVDVVTDWFGRPQGLAFAPDGRLFVVDALAGSAGLYVVDVTADTPVPHLFVAAGALIGVAFGAEGRAALASNDTVWNLDGMLTAPMEAA